MKSSNVMAHHYYVRDYLGSTRAVIDDAGNLLQTVNYYPSGVPFTLTDDDPVTDRLHTGKPFIDMQGLYHYDNNARIYDPLTGRFTTIDPLAGKYPSLTPYNHCANNPLSYIDPDGRVIRDAEGNILYYSSGETRKYIFELEEGNTEIVEVELGYIFADNWAPIEVLNNQTNDARFDTNCHGITFINGEYWLNSDQIPALLVGDNYIEVSKENASVNDVIISDLNNFPKSHSMTIISVKDPFDQSIVYGQNGPNTENYETTILVEFGNSNYNIYRKEIPEK
ncbi:MAG: hypothetical protein IKA19_03540 [Muribaculaceae bacterium]|nr:hypothetical protein [Muribaculaceae bacterium]